MKETFYVGLYDETEIKAKGLTLDDCVPREVKGCIFYMLKTEVAAELEWSKQRKAAQFTPG